MKDIKSKFSMFLVCLILGVILSIQFNTTQNVTDGANPITKSKALSVEIERLSIQKEELLKTLNDIESDIKGFEDEVAEKDNYLKSLYTELEKYNILVGYKDTQGPGLQIEIGEPEVEVTFDDGTNIIAANYDALLQIISGLNAANAEAISINDIRYTSYSTIEEENNSLIFDDHIINTPVIIRAIGDPKELEANLTIRGGIIDYVKRNLFLKINIVKKEDIVIPGLHKKIEPKYIRPVESLNSQL